ncbi:hypothetical protein A6B40_07355 [Mannheimia varigena]|uniref:PRD domain-containing protein n=1 Tax=Mannheimia varigena TaxID=85404 RepID=UPI00159E3BAC|nr:PRD domain-containing protein [Mannheimia varigena]QLB17410.1 hypothetical protein A6B40_07355 [Mannheimia varigena]
MQIIKVLNNSLLLALDNHGNECVLMGKGIGYHQAIGDQVDISQVEKTFLLKDKKVLLNFIQLANELDEDYFDLVKQIIEFAYQEYQIEVMDHLYLSLSDHIAFAVKRLQAGYFGENFAYFDLIKRHTPEFAIGKFAIQLIAEKFALELPESEASAIGLHFLNAKINAPQALREKALAELIKNIEIIVQRSINKPLNKESFSYSRFLTHITYFSERLLNKQLSREITEAEANSLYLSMQSQMPQELKILNKINNFIKSQQGIEISQQEKIYLLVHLNRLYLEA